MHPTTSGGVPGTCFVAMAFAKELDPAFDEGIDPAVVIDCGLRVMRTDRGHDNGIVNDLMLGQIRGCQVFEAEKSPLFDANGR
jgi:hypothetical protein